MTSLEVLPFWRKEFPAVRRRFCWDPERTSYFGHLRRLLDRPDQREGRIGDWTWQRTPCSYPDQEKNHCEPSASIPCRR